MEKITFISVVKDFEMYDNVIKNNPYVTKEGVLLNPIDNTQNNFGLSQRYNYFLNNYNYSTPSWFVFCHEDWEILENISKKLENLSKDFLYGTFGAKFFKKNEVLTREYIGNIYDCSKNGENLRRLGSEFENLTEVDTLDCQSLIVHSSLIEKYHLRFDEELSFDLYVEDFCLTSFVKHNIISRVLDLKICHWSQILDISERPSSVEKYPYINDKYKNYTFAGIIFNIGKDTNNILTKPLKIKMIDGRDRSMIYQTRNFTENEEKYICLNYITENRKILDVGCACGDFAAVLKEKKPADIWGMEYNQGSIDIARKTRAFEDIYKVDLNNFNPDNFKQFYNFFDYIVFGDVLEHINFPQKTLEIFELFLKSSGEFILSIPNVAHASIKANLLLDDFTYTPCGLLDETHIRFFTHKTISSFLANINLKIEESKFTYWDKMGFQSTNPFINLDVETKKLIYEDFHSYVLQYVMRVQKSDLSKEEIFEENNIKLFINEKNAPTELIKMQMIDLNTIYSEIDKIKELDKALYLKEQELRFVRSSKFWKLRNAYLKFKNKFL